MAYRTETCRHGTGFYLYDVEREELVSICTRADMNIEYGNVMAETRNVTRKQWEETKKICQKHAFESWEVW